MNRQIMLRSTYYPAGDGYYGMGDGAAYMRLRGRMTGRLYAPGYYPAGGFGSFLKKAAKAAVKVGAGFASGGFAGAAKAAIGLAGSIGSPTSPGVLTQTIMPTQGAAHQAALGRIVAASGGLQPGIGGGPAYAIETTKGVGRAINPRTGRPYRRMNPLNPKALRRGMRRVQAFARFASRTIQFTKRVKMKKRRRS